MKKKKLLLILFCIPILALAKREPVPFNDTFWEMSKSSKYSFEDFENRKTLFLDGEAYLADVNLSQGAIQVDIFGRTERSFAGIAFRSGNDQEEKVYLRMHKSGQVDAVQYTPIFHGESNWQLYPEFQSKVDFKPNDWNTLRIEFKAGNAIISVNGKIALKVKGLKTDNTDGSVGLWSLFGGRFSNFIIDQQVKDFKLDIDETIEEDPFVIRHWQLSKSSPVEIIRSVDIALDVEHNKTESDRPDFHLDNLTFRPMIFYHLNRSYTQVVTEPSGLLPISKYVKKQSVGSFDRNQEDYVVAKLEINTKKQETRRFSFDYSDKAIVYLNRREIFKGNNAFRSKGIQHTGHLSVDANTLYLNLREGRNVLHIVVIEKANGWGLIGKLYE